jgi:hypothetical protein
MDRILFTLIELRVVGLEAGGLAMDNSTLRSGQGNGYRQTFFGPNDYHVKV